MRLEFGQLLGAGAMGQVFAATTGAGVPVAVKVAWPHIAEHPRLRRLLDGEVRAMARLDHPHLLRILGKTVAPSGDPRLTPGTPCIVLEYCSGGTLEERPPTSFESLFDTLVALLDGLGHAHARGVLHRDLKPANVLLAAPSDARSGLKLADFGVAHAVGAAIGRRAIAGTPGYMAPEQAAGRTEALGPWSDLFALGCMTEELVTGRPPGDAPDTEPTTRFPVPAPLREWMQSLRRPEPGDRPRSAAAAWRLLYDLLPGQVPAPPSGWAEPPRVRVPHALGTDLVGTLAVPFLGREEERRALWTWVTGAAGVSSITGRAGLGKTRLLRWLCERVAETGTAEVVLLDLAAAADPYQALVLGVLGLVDLPPAERVTAVPKALAALGLPPGDVEVLLALWSEGGDRWGSVPAVESLVREACRRPTLLAFDGVDRSVGAERLALGLLVRPLPGLHVVTTGAALQGATLLQLQPLAHEDVEALVHTYGGLEADAASALASAAAGHPGYAMELLASWLHQGVLKDGPRGRSLHGTPAGPVGWDLRLERLVSNLDPLGIAALECAAVQGVRVDEELWEASCAEPGGPGTSSGLSPVHLRARLEVLGVFLDQGWCEECDGGFVFTQPGLVDALVARAAAAGRLEGHHAAIVAHLGNGDSSALERGRHLLGAGRPREALEPLVSALQASTNGDARSRELLLRLLSSAIDSAHLPADHAARVDHAIGRSAHALQAARVEDAQRWASSALEMAERLGDRALLGRALVRSSDALSVLPPARAMAVLVRIEPLLDTLPLRWQVIQLGRLARLRASAGDLEAAASLYARVDALARSKPADPIVQVGLLQSLDSRGSWEALATASATTLRIARQQGDLGSALYASNKRIEALVNLERHDEALAELDLAAPLARQLGQLRAQVLQYVRRLEIHSARSSWRALAATADEALAVERETGLPRARLLLLLYRATAAGHLADPDIAAWAVETLEGLEAPEASWSGADVVRSTALALEARYPALSARVAALLQP